MLHYLLAMNYAEAQRFGKQSFRLKRDLV